MWVTASKDFRYDDVVGDVKTGQVFELRGQPNDGGLLKHGLVMAVEPQPDREALKHYPQCGTCGRQFAEVWQRERCGRMHELSAGELRKQRREEAGKRLDKLRTAGQLT
ncbi:MAG TPA: hypothetical protein PKH77_05170 [Anaerolineae bacterium]|nr:hypothetical protein [Anaerolineae bacterium]